MVHIYYRLIKEGMKTIDQVPTSLKDQVQALLDAETA
nr:CD1375 family protein [Brevibacillus reuszeri]